MTTMTGEKAVYTAVPLLDVPLLSEEEKAEEEAFLASQEQRQQQRKTKTLPFLVGSIIGAVFSVIGFKLLVKNSGHDSYKNIFFFALLWSTVTSTVAYVLFGLSWSALLRVYKDTAFYQMLSDYDYLADIEYYFALGVFLGFCFACTLADIAYGLPFVGISLTVLVAAIWTIVMTYFAYRDYDGDDEDDEGEEQPKGTALPTVVV